MPYQLDLKVKNTAYPVDTSRANKFEAEYLDLRDTVIGIIGDYSSGNTLDIARWIMPNTLLISPASTSPLLTDYDDSNLLWRTPPSDVYQGKLAAQYAYDKLLKRKVFVIAIDNPYGRGLYESFKQTFTTLPNGVLIDTVFYKQSGATGTVSEEEFAKITRKIQDSVDDNNKPDLVYIIAYPETAAKLTGSLKHFSIDYLMSEASYDQSFIDNADSTTFDRIQGLRPYVGNANYDIFADKFEKKYASPAPIYSEGVYDAVYLMAYSMVKIEADSMDNTIWGPKIADNLLPLSIEGTNVDFRNFAATVDSIKNGANVNYRGASGEVDFNANGDITNGEIWSMDYNKWKFEDIESLYQLGRVSTLPTKKKV